MSVRFLTTPVRAAAAPGWAASSSRTVRITPDLRPAFLATGAAQQNLERLFDGALCVTTGQQPGLLTGPLYTIYKALSAVAYAQAAEKELGRPVVPVFWVAGDDHDFAEANHLNVLDAAGDAVRIELRSRDPSAPLTPLYREPVGAEIAGVLERLRETLPETEFRAGVFEWLERHYRADRDLASAFAGALAELLGSRGVLVFQPTHVAAKRLMAPWVLRSLEQSADLSRALAERGRAMAAGGLPVPVPVEDGATPVMVEASLGRDRLIRDGSHFVTRRGGERWTLDELKRLVDRSPEVLSPNVLLRPVIEAAILPTVAYVGGPGELAYLPQCEPLYQALGVAPQLHVPRWSALAIEGRVEKVLDKYGITPADLSGPAGSVEGDLVRDDLPEEIRGALSVLRAILPEQYARLMAASTAIDPTLEKPVESARNAALAGITDIERRIVGRLKQRNELLLTQVAKARASLFPMGKSQERVLNIVPFLVRYGDEFLADAEAAADAYVRALEPAAARP